MSRALRERLAARDLTREGRNLATSRARSGAPKQTCDDCFFRAQNLCALGLDEPCPTFRPDTPAGLVPPRQPALLMREPAQQQVHAAAAA